MALGLELEEEPTHWRLAVSGELDAGGCSRLRMNVDRILRYRPDLVIVDLSELEFLDSSGLGILLSLSREYSAGEGRLVLVTGGPVDTLLSHVGLDRMFTIVSSMREALEAGGHDMSASDAPRVRRAARTKKSGFDTAERTTQM